MSDDDIAIEIIVPKGPDETNLIDMGLLALTEAIEISGAAEIAHGFFGGEFGYGAKYENAVFWMVPDYQDAECSCGFNDKAGAWHRTNPHLETCYFRVRQARIRQWEIENNMDAVDAASHCDVFTVNGRRFSSYEAARAAWRTEAGEFTSNRSPVAKAAFQAWRKLHDRQNKAEDAISRALCEELEIPWNKGWGAAVHCTCGVDERAMAWFGLPENHHAKMCAIVVPNFWHKASGAEVRWYKYIGRDQKIEAPPGIDWAIIFNECLASLPRKEPK